MIVKLFSAQNFDGGVLKLFVFKVLVWNYMLKIISNQKLGLI